MLTMFIARGTSVHRTDAQRVVVCDIVFAGMATECGYANGIVYHVITVRLLLSCTGGRQLLPSACVNAWEGGGGGFIPRVNNCCVMVPRPQRCVVLD
jgi:hypothetical protein